MARPRKEIDEQAVEQAIAHGNTVDDAATILGVSKDTLERRFAACIEKGRANMRASLRKRQFELALGGNVTMQIWLGKQLLGQADKVQHTGAGDGPIRTEHTEKHVVDYDAIETELAKIGTRMAGRAAANGNGQSVHSD